MAREINSRLKITGILKAETPLHVGGYGESYETDMALAKNGNDEFYIPGTSLTGALRSWFENAFDEKETIESWGFQEDDKQRIGTKNDRSKASFVLVEDMRLPEDLRNSLQSELRDGVGINRFYGTAADGIKYDRAILPKGAKLDFEMTVEVGKEQDANKIKARFGHLLEALQKGEIRLGASKTRGLGKVKLELKEVAENSLNTKKGILNLVEKKSEKTYQIQDLINFDKSVISPTNEQIKIEITWKPKSPLMVKAGYEGIGVDTLPLVSANGKDKVSLCLPGSSVKGAFRAHAERILRTFSEKTVKDEKFDEQIQTPLIDELFGAKKDAPKDSDSDVEKTRKERLGLGALSVDDCFAERKMDAKVWQDVEVGEFPNDKTYSDTDLHQALKKIDLAKNTLSNDEKKTETNAFHISHHTAIDRFTGAASDGALYSILKPSPTIGWENLHLSLDLKRLSTKEGKYCALMLILLVLRDFAENRLPLGFATNRGMGEVKDVSFKVTGAYDINYQAGNFDFTDANLKTEMQTAWDDLEV